MYCLTLFYHFFSLPKILYAIGVDGLLLDVGVTILLKFSLMYVLSHSLLIGLNVLISADVGVDDGDTVSFDVCVVVSLTSLTFPHSLLSYFGYLTLMITLHRIV